MGAYSEPESLGNASVHVLSGGDTTVKGKVSARFVYTFLAFKQTRERMSVRAGEQARRELQGCLWYLTGAIRPLFD